MQPARSPHGVVMGADEVHGRSPFSVVSTVSILRTNVTLNVILVNAICRSNVTFRPREFVPTSPWVQTTSPWLSATSPSRLVGGIDVTVLVGIDREVGRQVLASASMDAARRRRGDAGLRRQLDALGSVTGFRFSLGPVPPVDPGELSWALGARESKVSPCSSVAHNRLSVRIPACRVPSDLP
jgi:hypothetical protein